MHWRPNMPETAYQRALMSAARDWQEVIAAGGETTTAAGDETTAAADSQTAAGAGLETAAAASETTARCLTWRDTQAARCPTWRNTQVKRAGGETPAAAGGATPAAAGSETTAAAGSETTAAVLVVIPGQWFPGRRLHLRRSDDFLYVSQADKDVACSVLSVAVAP